MKIGKKNWPGELEGTLNWYIQGIPAIHGRWLQEQWPLEPYYDCYWCLHGEVLWKNTQSDGGGGSHPHPCHLRKTHTQCYPSPSNHQNLPPVKEKKKDWETPSYQNRKFRQINYLGISLFQFFFLSLQLSFFFFLLFFPLLSRKILPGKGRELEKEEGDGHRRWMGGFRQAKLRCNLRCLSVFLSLPRLFHVVKRERGRTTVKISEMDRSKGT